MPSFHRYPKEAHRIGRIIAAFGELEFILGLALAEALGNQDTALRTLFKLRSDTSRLDVAESLLQPICANLGFESKLADAMLAVRKCQTIRNQYAHCHFGDVKRQGLFFTDLQDAAKRTLFEYFWRHVNVKLLDHQEKYFRYTIQCLQFIEQELRLRLGRRNIPHATPWPTKLSPPLPHNPPTAHIPRWLSEEGRRRHIEIALEWEYGAGLRQRPPKAQKAPKPSSRQRRDAAMKKASKK